MKIAKNPPPTPRFHYESAAVVNNNQPDVSDGSDGEESD